MTGYKSGCAPSIRALGPLCFQLRANMLRFLLLGLLAVGFATADYSDIQTADKEFLIKQKKVYNLLYHVSQPHLVNIPAYNEGRAWSIQNNMDGYSNRVSNSFLYLQLLIEVFTKIVSHSRGIMVRRFLE